MEKRGRKDSWFQSELTLAQRDAAAWKLGSLTAHAMMRQGAYFSNRAGSSTEYLDQRPFFRGDDVRHINWQAFARTEQVMVNVFEQESAPLIDLVIDTSSSMRHYPEKWKMAWRVWAFLSVLGVDAGSRVRAFIVDGDNWKECPWRHPEVEAEDPDVDPEHAGVAGVLKIPYTPGSYRFLISDFLFDTHREELLDALARDASGFSVCAPFVREEADPQWEGNIEFEDVETRENLSHLCDSAFVKRYRERYRAHFSAWNDAAERRAGCLLRIDSGEALTSAVSRSFVRRGIVKPR